MESNLTKVKDKNKIDFPKLLDHALSNVVDLAKAFSSGDIALKRQIISSIFPEKLEFFENHYRTIRANVLLSYIYQINNELGAKKNRKESELSPLSGLVPSAGIEPAHLSILEFESSASTNSANWADVCFKLVCKYRNIFDPIKMILDNFYFYFLTNCKSKIYFY